MAIQDGKFLRGPVGPTVHKVYRDKQVITSKPTYNPNKRTKPSIKAADHFGVSSNLACSVRENFVTVIQGLYDGPMINRLRDKTQTVLTAALNPETDRFTFSENSFNRFNGLEFNEDSPVRDNFFVQPETLITGNELKVIIPEMHIPKDLKFPKDATSCLLNIAVGLYDLTYGHMMLDTIQSTEIAYTYDHSIQPAQEFIFEIEPGCLCIVVLSLQYLRKTFAGNMLTNSKTFSPTAILKAIITAGDVNKENTKKWEEIKFSTTTLP